MSIFRVQIKSLQYFVLQLNTANLPTNSSSSVYATLQLLLLLLEHLCSPMATEVVPCLVCFLFLPPFVVDNDYSAPVGTKEFVSNWCCLRFWLVAGNFLAHHFFLPTFIKVDAKCTFLKAAPVDKDCLFYMVSPPAASEQSNNSPGT
jgi:hypothetical protein